MPDDPVALTRRAFPSQLAIDYRTWIPVAFHSWFDDPPVLYQLWVTPFGQTEWRKVETRNIKQMTKAYVECQVFGDDQSDDRDE